MEARVIRIFAHRPRGIGTWRCAGLGALLLLVVFAACSGDAPGTISGPGTGPGPGNGPGSGDPGPVGRYSLSMVNGQATPALIDAVVLGPSTIQSYVLGGTIDLKADGSYKAAVHGRWIMDGTVLDRTSEGSGTWQLTNAGTLRLQTSQGGSIYMERTWYTLTETRKIPAASGADVDVIYVWVIE
jgi:hypothetical protein